MAKAANNENVGREIEGPDFKGAIELIRGPVAKNKSDASSLGQDNSTIFKRIDKQYGVHRGAANTFASIDRMQKDKRVDYLRSLLGLLSNAGYDGFNDLVDRMGAAPTAQAKPDKKGKTKKAADQPLGEDQANAFLSQASQPPADDSDLVDAAPPAVAEDPEPKFVVYDPANELYLAKEGGDGEWDDRKGALLLSRADAERLVGEHVDTVVQSEDGEPAPTSNVSPISAALEKSRAHLTAVPDALD